MKVAEPLSIDEERTRAFIRCCVESRGPLPEGQREAFSDVAARHGMQSFVAPSALVTSAKRLVVLMHELRIVLELFEIAGLEPIVLKGAAVACEFYEEPACRVFTDLDILIRFKDLPRAREILIARGYRAPNPVFASARKAFEQWSSEMHLTHPATGICVDLHWALNPLCFPARLPVKDLRSRSRTLRIEDLSLRTLSPPDNLLYLCVHAAKHGWSNLGWIVDICHLIRRTPDLDYAAFLQQAKAAHAENLVWFALVTASEYVPAVDIQRAPPHIVKAVREHSFANDQGLTDLAGLAMLWKLRDGAARQIRFGLILIFLPTEADWLWFDFPLYPYFYLPLRLLRLASKWPRKLLKHV